MSGSARADLEKAVFAVVAAVVVAGGLVSAAIMARSDSAPRGAAPPRPTTSSIALTQTVLYRSYDGFQVCTRHQLHDCILTFVRSDGVTKSLLRIGPFSVAPATACASIEQDAIGRCGDAGVDPFHTVPGTERNGPTREWLSCAARHGFFHRSGSATMVLDPRDETPAIRSLAPGLVHLQCNEGFASATSANTL